MMLPRGVAAPELLELAVLLAGCRRTLDTRPGGPVGGAMLLGGAPERLCAVPVRAV